METFLLDDDDSIQVSNTPRRSPTITRGHASPVRSVHPQMQQMVSINDQADFGLRTADFFDDTSDEESPTLKRRQDAPSLEPLVSQCESNNTTIRPDRDGYERLAPTAFDDDKAAPETPSSSFNGSVDELLPGGSGPQRPPKSRVSSGRTPRSSLLADRLDSRASKVDQTLGAYAIAHEITLQALMRDEDAVDKSLNSFALSPLQQANRNSLLPPSLTHSKDPRSPRSHHFSSPETSKKVHVLPPPIDTSALRRSIPEDIVRTPYPFAFDAVKNKDFGQSHPSGTDIAPTLVNESVLIVSIRRSNPNSRLRKTTLTIPASNEFSAIRSSSPRSKEHHFKALDFDDAAFFRNLRVCYHRLVGPMCYLSARSLSRITVSGAASKAANTSYGWLSPPATLSRGLTDDLSEEKILQHYRKPALGKSRYAFVQWAHRLAAVPAVRTPQPDEEAGDAINSGHTSHLGQAEGLEFIVSWSLRRILLVFFIVLVISIAAALLWIFLGRSGWHTHSGFRHAGERVTSGILIGICILLLGLSGTAGWLGVSWLVM